ncbi:MAG: nucleotidyltransferase domain-containing protein [Lachnospiraceae bacterium]|nr:nucleotidyltransferase domain-containing protein [Lachnospiraceae bacterium]
MSEKIRNVLEQYQEEVRQIYGSHLKKVVIYGSYARGDQKEDSDIDLMIFTDLTDEAISKSRRSLSNCTYEFNWNNQVEIMPIVVNEKHFDYWKKAYVFYMNIDKEGKVL